MQEGNIARNLQNKQKIGIETHFLPPSVKPINIIL
jgi:hypothetical protein